jgi:GNAT superfamily N-acetyltransferase
LDVDAAISIRQVTDQDFDAWKPLWDGYNAFYGRAGDNSLADAITRATWARFLDAAEPMHALVAERSGRMLGLAHYLFHRSTTNTSDSCYMQDLFTTEESRGTGIGRALIEAVSRQARQAGAARVYWQTHETNALAMQLYDKVAEKSGFIVYRKLL